MCPGVGVTKCDPAETYPHSAQFGTDDETYVMYQMPNWAFNEIGDMLGADFMNRVYAGTVVLDDSDIPEYGELGSGCYADAGDVTGDGIINVLDIVGLVNHILGSALLDDTCDAEYTGDTIVNVLDIVCLVNLILGNDINSYIHSGTIGYMVNLNLELYKITSLEKYYNRSIKYADFLVDLQRKEGFWP